VAHDRAQKIGQQLRLLLRLLLLLLLLLLSTNRGDFPGLLVERLRRGAGFLRVCPSHMQSAQK
jgi:hypothetical protein